MGDAPPPPQQPPPPYQPPPPPSAGSGVDPKIAALLSYLLSFVAWFIPGLIFYLIEKQNLEVRFHAAQAVLLNIAYAVAWIAAIIVSIIFAFLGPLALLSVLLWFVLGIGGLALLILMSIKGYNLEHYKLPLIGDMAEKWAAKPV